MLNTVCIILKRHNCRRVPFRILEIHRDKKQKDIHTEYAFVYAFNGLHFISR